MSIEDEKDAGNQEAGEKRPSRESKSSKDNGERKSRSNRHRSSSRDSQDDILGGSERKSSGAKPERRKSKDFDALGGSDRRSSHRPSRRQSRDSHDGNLDTSKRSSGHRSRSRDTNDALVNDNELGGSSGAKPERRKSKDSDALGGSDRRSSHRPSRRKSKDSDALDTSKRSSTHRSRSRDSNDSLANNNESSVTRDEKAKARSRRKSSAPAMPGAFVEAAGEDRAVRRKRDSADKGKESLGTKDRDTTDREAKNRARRQPGETMLGTSQESKDRRAKDQARRSVGGAVRPGASSETRGSRQAKTKRDISRRSTGASENEIGVPAANSVGWTGDVEAVEAMAVDEMASTPPSAPQEVREQTLNQSTEEDGNKAIVATARPDNKGRKYKYMLAAFVVFAIIAGVLVWLLVLRESSEPDDVSATSIFSPPTTEDCQTISEGMETAGQMGTTVKYFGVEMDFEVAPDVDLEFLQSELQMRIQRDVLPLVAGCDKESSTSTGSDTFIVENGVLKTISIGDLVPCSSNPQGLCSFVYLQLDVFSKDADVQGAVLLGLIFDVFQEDGLLQDPKLLSPVEDIDFITAYEILPSSNPSSSPTIQDDGGVPVDNGSPSQETCDAIANGTPVLGQDDLVAQEYDILMDVTLDSETEELSPLTMELDEKIQRFLLPSLAGCTIDRRRRLQIESFVVNAFVDSEVSIGGACLPDSETACYRYVIHLDIYVQRTVASADFSSDIVGKFREAPLVERLGMLAPFKNIVIVEIYSDAVFSESPSAEPSNNPTDSPSVNPTTAPVTYPTTEEPTRSPTIAPSFAPSLSPSSNPTLGVTSAPTLIPTLQPVVGPTLEPTPLPTPLPTPAPTIADSASPTADPTTASSLTPTAEPSVLDSAQPSGQPSGQPSLLPSVQPSSRPSKSPSAQPSALATTQCFESNTELSGALGNWFDSPFGRQITETQYGLIGDWCFGAGVTSMKDLFKNRATFNSDISNWDVSSVVNMQSMFQGASSFNQNLSLWDVSSVTNMRLMFEMATSFNGDISTWDVSSVTQMNNMFQVTFKNPSAFNQDLSQWDVSSVTNMHSMFYGARSFNQDLSGWDVSSVTNMAFMFYETPFNQDLPLWNVASVTKMNNMFQWAGSFNGDISTWDVGSVTSMIQMFDEARAFNGDIASWDVSSVTSTDRMFSNAAAFNQDISMWNFASCTNMILMFNQAESFNQDISSWDVSSVTNMRDMFQYASAFNQDLSSWDISSVSDMRRMFQFATSFNQDLCPWGPILQGNVQFEGLFASTNCPLEADPDLTATPRGPFCNLCVPGN
ncbi:unnamed protein product [Cylindrotheca closterium]|uniref:Circumsporozoite protein n=1 Tax=Cylindrotheca closterium TaxID=2856 RepID=A0AAD2G4J5_9STRA|nr:unnamed protein product [Cylindrotheca closterium]